MNFFIKNLSVLHLLCGALGAASVAIPTAQTAPEIELKFQLDTAELDTLFGTIDDNPSIKFKEEAEHKEWYFNNPAESFWFNSDKGFSDAYTTLRVRQTAKKSTWCQKIRHVDAAGKTISRDETEEPIKNAEEKVEELKKAGFTDILQFKKTRKKYVDGPFELVIDTIAGRTDDKDFILLGTFIEVEYTEKGVSVDKGMELIKKFLAEMLGLVTVKVIDRSYPHMLKNPGWEKHREWGFWWNENLTTGATS